MYTCICVYVHMCIYVYVHVCIYITKQYNVYVCVCVRVCVRAQCQPVACKQLYARYLGMYACKLARMRGIVCTQGT